ncbi:hypothetical protein L211DRAFT_194425 [Terfezia boudieri ATCC MYA-4762]|uniref:Uncharacterized protein n=1 Tax=Terfezia boudieri ATCC MYA-4762 TaxID=1051890 RepID=A0A3N4LND2_9PEZI|nr:hypothetical protein L211DRAFT_194425 [Terfezia boudieri ATCC MYA-4762]
MMSFFLVEGTLDILVFWITYNLLLPRLCPTIVRGGMYIRSFQLPDGAHLLADLYLSGAGVGAVGWVWNVEYLTSYTSSVALPRQILLGGMRSALPGVQRLKLISCQTLFDRSWAS